MRGDDTPVTSTAPEGPANVALSPTAGGLVLFEDTVLLPYTSNGPEEVPSREAMLAVGH